MSRIRIRHEHKLSATEAAARLELLAGELGRSYGLRVDLRDGTANFAGMGISGRAVVDAQAVEVEADLPLFFPAGPVEQGVREALRKHFG
jgi:putative polyhydroxyalkanoate system protein